MKRENWRIVQCSGAIVAFLIGSGFASGQEIMQFFSGYGPVCGGLAVLISSALLTWCAGTVMEDARQLQLEDANGIFRFYCGRYLGAVLEWLSPVFLFGVYVIMLSGAGSLISEYYGMPQIAGRLILLVLSLGTVLLGLERLTTALGFIGPMIILCTLGIGGWCVFTGWDQILVSEELVRTSPVVTATPYWWLSGTIYATFCGFTLIPYLGGLGRTVSHRRTALWSGWLGAGIFSLATLVLCYGLLACWSQVSGRAVPTVAMADSVLHGAGILFSVMMLAGIYTTSVPMLWACCNKLAHDDRSPRFRIVAVILAVLAFFGGKLPFEQLVNVIYPYIGYIGIAVYAGVVLRKIRKRSAASAKSVP